MHCERLIPKKNNVSFYNDDEDFFLFIDHGMQHIHLSDMTATWDASFHAAVPRSLPDQNSDYVMM